MIKFALRAASTLESGEQRAFRKFSAIRNLSFIKGNVVLRQVVKTYFHLNCVIFQLHLNRSAFQVLSSINISDRYFL